MSSDRFCARWRCSAPRAVRAAGISSRPHEAVPIGTPAAWFTSGRRSRRPRRPPAHAVERPLAMSPASLHMPNAGSRISSMLKRLRPTTANPTVCLPITAAPRRPTSSWQHAERRTFCSASCSRMRLASCRRSRKVCDFSSGLFAEPSLNFRSAPRQNSSSRPV
jgi:hypothetical protein